MQTAGQTSQLLRASTASSGTAAGTATTEEAFLLYLCRLVDSLLEDLVKQARNLNYYISRLLNNN